MQRFVFSLTALQAVRQMGGHGKHFIVEPSRFQWHKFKDIVHYYLLVGAIPCLAVVFYANVFIGPATLSEIPEGYEPKHWEYYRHPITRWMARYWYETPQEQYEKMLHKIYEESEKAKMRLLEQDIKAKMGKYQDYQAYYYTPVTAKYQRWTKEIAEDMEKRMGD